MVVSVEMETGLVGNRLLYSLVHTYVPAARVKNKQNVSLSQPLPPRPRQAPGRSGKRRRNDGPWFPVVVGYLGLHGSSTQGPVSDESWKKKTGFPRPSLAIHTACVH